MNNHSPLARLVGRCFVYFPIHHSATTRTEPQSELNHAKPTGLTIFRRPVKACRKSERTGGSAAADASEELC
jgi:hypothetical protein